MTSSRDTHKMNLCPLLEIMGNSGFKINVNINSLSLQEVRNPSQILFNSCFQFPVSLQEMPIVV